MLRRKKKEMCQNLMESNDCSLVSRLKDLQAKRKTLEFDINKNYKRFPGYKEFRKCKNIISSINIIESLELDEYYNYDFQYFIDSILKECTNEEIGLFIEIMCEIRDLKLKQTKRDKRIAAINKEISEIKKELGID